MPHRTTIDTGYRLSIDPLWTPAQLSLEAWYDATDGDSFTLDGGTVTTWADRSGNGRDMGQSSPTLKPGYNTSDSRMNGLPSVGYDGDLQKWVRTSASFAIKETYVISYYDNATFGSWDIMVGCGTNIDDPEERFGGWNGNDYFQDNGSDTIYKNASTVTNYADNTGKPVVLPMTIAMWDNTWDASTTSDWTLLSQRQSYQRWGRHGALGEVIFTDGTESAADRAKIEGYLAWKWGIQGDLPGGHAYVSEPPFL